MTGGTHLTLEERERLAALKAEGLSLRGIARALGRAASTISRELRRNALPKGGYLPVHAEGCYRERRQRPAVLERDPKLGRFVRDRLLEGWTPEQIAGWLKRGEERQLRAVSCETVYAFVHRAGQKAEKLWKLLPRGRARRGRRRARPPRGTIAGRRSIHDRPEAVQERKDAGHWEGDLLICKRTRPVLVLKERKTRFVLAARLAGKSAAETVAVLMAVFRRLDPRLRSSITFDNDTAFARHGLLASACGMTTWFCACNYPHLSTPNQCLAGFVQIVSLCAELFEGSPRQATLSGSNIDRSRNYNGPCGWSEMWVIASVRWAIMAPWSSGFSSRSTAARPFGVGGVGAS